MKERCYICKRTEEEVEDWFQERKYKRISGDLCEITKYNLSDYGMWKIPVCMMCASLMYKIAGDKMDCEKEIERGNEINDFFNQFF